MAREIFAESSEPLSEPALKMGTLMLGMKVQVPRPPSNRLESESLERPVVAVSEMVGKKAARAAPMLALAAFSVCSAASTSGLSSSTFDDRLAGSGASATASASTWAPGSGSRASGTREPTTSSRALMAWPSSLP